jgi:hypothetical protein
MAGARCAGTEGAWPYAYSWRHSDMVSTFKRENGSIAAVQHLHELSSCRNGEAELHAQIFPCLQVRMRSVHETSRRRLSAVADDH